MSLYLLINLLVLLIPLVFSFDNKVSFHREWPWIFPAFLITGSFFIIWDILFTHYGLWGFNPRYLAGWSIAGLPLEEWLFFITIPYASVFTYRVLNVWKPLTPSPVNQRIISYALLLIFASIVLFFYNRTYTLVTFSLAVLFIFISEWVLKVTWLLNFYRAYLIILFPFTIINGLLTGTGLEQSVVWYNHTENMNLRLLTIPFEDVVYGFLLIGINIALFERFRRKTRIKSPHNKHNRGSSALQKNN